MPATSSRRRGKLSQKQIAAIHAKKGRATAAKPRRKAAAKKGPVLTAKRRGQIARQQREEKFVQQHGKLVYSTVNKQLRRIPGGRKGNPELAKDLDQIGMMALVQAGRKHDPKKGAVSTLAVKHIEGALRRAMKKQGPVSINERAVRRELEAKTKGKKGALGLPTGASYEAGAHDTASIKGRGQIDLQAQSEAKLTLSAMVKKAGLSKRDGKVLYLSSEHKPGEIAKKLKISRSQVHRILKSAMAKMKAVGE